MANLKDYTGQKFGRLECLSVSKQKKSANATYWRCRCNCGKIVDVQITDVVSGHTKSCGCLRREKARAIRNKEDYTGQKFERLECISFTERIKGEAFWKCRCDCGREVNVRIISVVRGDTKSCGCLKREAVSKTRKSQFKDYRGQKFGRLECISLSEPAQVGRVTYWKCKCDCGNLIDANIALVVRGSTRSCGCLRSSFKDYTGERFGRLECISPSEPKRVNGKTYWQCRCDCGNIRDFQIANVVSGSTNSCGCYKRSGDSKS
ncbi:bacteriophage protein homolog (plasmid) [Calothrix sp. NIES-4071]|nr:bacteriophage protein homolog [Calothrix sp. NIES-4071]BAZ64865.1 bacteriophage protein homolog [Calothrix sp. NIES-4105]